MPQKAIGDSQPLWAHVCKGACGPLESNLTNSGWSSKDVSSIMARIPGFISSSVCEREAENQKEEEEVVVEVIQDDGLSIAQSIVEHVAEVPACTQTLKQQRSSN